MARIVLSSMDEKIVKAAIEEHGKRDVYVAMDDTVDNRHTAKELGLDRYALIGADKAPAPAKKAEKPKKVEAKKDVKSKAE